MIEYGLSVSLNGSPRTPMGQPSPMCGCDVVAAAPSKLRFGDSVSPRALLCKSVARCLDFSSEHLDDLDVSPVSFASASASASASAHANMVGDCSVCYAALPPRSNHVFTLCGHLFCVRCLLKWWDTSSSCPICRAELLERDDDDDVGADAVADPDWMNPPPLPIEEAGAGAGAGPGSEDANEEHYDDDDYSGDDSDDSYNFNDPYTAISFRSTSGYPSNMI